MHISVVLLTVFTWWLIDWVRPSQLTSPSSLPSTEFCPVCLLHCCLGGLKKRKDKKMTLLLYMQYSLMFRDTVLHRRSVSFRKEHPVHWSCLLWPIWGAEEKNKTQKVSRHPYLHNQSRLADLNSRFFDHRQENVPEKGSCVEALRNQTTTQTLWVQRENWEEYSRLWPNEGFTKLWWRKQCRGYWENLIRMLT